MSVKSRTSSNQIKSNLFAEKREKKKKKTQQDTKAGIL